MFCNSWFGGMSQGSRYMASNALLYNCAANGKETRTFIETVCSSYETNGSLIVRKHNNESYKPLSFHFQLCNV